MRSTVEGDEALDAITALAQIALGMAGRNLDLSNVSTEELARVASTALGLCVCAAAKLGHDCGVEHDKVRALVSGYVEQALAALSQGEPVTITAKGGEA